MRRSLQEIRSLLQKAVAKNMDFIARCEKDQNPQVRDMVLHSKGRLEGYRDSLNALNGDTVFLRMEANPG